MKGRVVPEAGLEPARVLPRGILNPLCLPISSLWHRIFSACENVKFPKFTQAILLFIQLFCKAFFVYALNFESAASTNFATLAHFIFLAQNLTMRSVSEWQAL